MRYLNGTEPMADVTRLITYVDVDDRDARGISLSALHQAILDDGRRVVLLNDRGWTGNDITSASVEEMKETARVVVGPDEPFGDRSQTDMEVAHLEALARTLGPHGVAATAATLRGLPHDVELSDRLLGLTDPVSRREHGERGAD
jgi:hypothetical protein